MYSVSYLRRVYTLLFPYAPVVVINNNRDGNFLYCIIVFTPVYFCLYFYLIKSEPTRYATNLPPNMMLNGGNEPKKCALKD